VNVDELVRQTKVLAHMCCQRWCAITFGGMVTARKKGDAGLLGQMRLRLGNFTGDKRVGPGGDRAFKP
jgi:hypothetical protein